MRRPTWPGCARHATAVLAVFALAAGAASPSPTQPSSPSKIDPRTAPFIEGEILVKFRSETPAASRGALRLDVAGSVRRRFASGAELWRLGPGIAVPDALARVKNMPGVEYAEPNYIVHAAKTPDDPFFPQQYALTNTGQKGGAAGSDIDAASAWDISTGGASILVAVLDTGIDVDHPDLAPNLWTNPDEIPGNLVDDDGNGLVDDVHGWDYVNHDDDPHDDYGHGTHVAGILAAAGDNGVGIAGVAWRASILPLKFLDQSGSGTTSDAISAIDYAAARGARIINASWGGGGFSMAMLDAIRDAATHQVLFVAAAGNDATDSDQIPFFPAGFDSPNIIAVAASDRSDRLAPFSNHGRTTVDLAAPGVEIYSTLPGGAYGFSSGTSMATPHVSGVAALILGFAPGMSAESLRRRLLDHAEPVAALADEVATAARLNAYQCLLGAERIPPGPVVDLRVAESLSDGLVLRFTSPGDDLASGAPATYDLRISESPFDASGFEAAPRFAVPGVPLPFGSTETKEIGGLEPSRTYHLGLRAIDEWGNIGPAAFATATTLPPPALQATPDSFSASLLSGTTGTAVLTLRNTGEGTLDWSAQRPILRPVVRRAGTPVPERWGGPDGFGYVFSDSDEPDGPVFAWEDIIPTGRTAIIAGDDLLSEPIPLGFSFPFYGQTFDSVRIATNGFLTFTAADPTFVNQSLPSPGAPGNLVAGFWDDLLVPGLQNAVYLAAPHAFTVQYDEVLRIGGGGPYTFQITLFDSGEIQFQYLEMSNLEDTATIGVQDDSGSAGLSIAFDAPYVHDRLAVRLRTQKDWVRAAPQSGRLRRGESAPVTLTFDASRLGAGPYEGWLPIGTNDPESRRVEFPLNLSVEDARAIAAEPAAVDFGTVLVGHPWQSSAEIVNNGSLPLSVLAVVPDDPTVRAAFAPLVLAPGERGALPLEWHPVALGGLRAHLHIDSDAVNASPLIVPLDGLALNREIAAEPAAIDFGTVLLGHQRESEAGIVNGGGLPLSVGAVVSDDSTVRTTFAPLVLAPGERGTIHLEWHPLALGGLHAHLRIDSDAANASPLIVPLDGFALNLPPDAAAIWPPAHIECTSPSGTDVVFDATPSRDDEAPPDSSGIVLYEWIEDPGSAGERLLGTGARLARTLPPGTHRLELRVTDIHGGVGTTRGTVTVADTTPPELTLAVSPSVLWPPNHRMVPVNVTLSAGDACSSAVSVRLAGITSSEPDDAPGSADGQTTGDAVVIETGQPATRLLLRAERSALGSGRAYTMRYVVTDAAGLTTEREAVIPVQRPAAQARSDRHGSR
jgi:subtilisin family serine protease